MTEQIKKIEESVKNLIKEGRIRMKPRWYFILKSFLKVLFILILFLILVYSIIFVNFLLHERIVFKALAPNIMGFGKFFIGIPWLIILLSFITLIILEILIRKYSFVYKKPLVYSLFFVIFFIFIMSLFVIKLDKRKNIPRFGEDRNIPIFTPMHKYYRGDFKDFRNLEKGKGPKKNPDFKDLERPFKEGNKNFEIFE